MTEEKYHVMVHIEVKPGKWEWRPMRPTGGRPYEFDKATAESWAHTYNLENGFKGQHKIQKVEVARIYD